MGLRKTYTIRKTVNGGFTLIETLVVVSLLTMIVSMTLFFDVASFRRTSFQAEAHTLAIALQTARADSLNNVNQEKHGVAINPGGFDGYVIFEGDDYASSDSATRVSIPSSYRVTKGAGTPDEIVFAQLSGNADWNGNVELIDPERSATTSIGINYEGRIDW